MSEEANKQFAQATIKDGVIRWNANDRVPFDDMLVLFENSGLITRAIRDASNTARHKDCDEFAAKYLARQAHRPSAEQSYELRAAFGPGETVVNVLTGRKHRT